MPTVISDSCCCAKWDSDTYWHCLQFFFRATSRRLIRLGEKSLEPWECGFSEPGGKANDTDSQGFSPLVSLAVRFAHCLSMQSGVDVIPH